MPLCRQKTDRSCPAQLFNELSNCSKNREQTVAYNFLDNYLRVENREMIDLSIYSIAFG